MKREVIYRTDAMAAVGNLKGLSDTDKSKAMQAVLDVPAVQTCEDAISRRQAVDALIEQMPSPFTADGSHPADEEIFRVQETYADCIETIKLLPTVQPQPEEDCDTCKHGFFGDRQCDNCRVRYPSHYEREEEQDGSD